MTYFYCLDERDIWHQAACDAARRHGIGAQRIFSGDEVQGPGIGFIRPHADWRQLPKNREDYVRMKSCLTMIQDDAQVEVYEDKSEQFNRWSDWMPDTWFFMDEGQAQAFVAEASYYPLVSKADVGASSVNVRILYTREEAQRHIAKLFGDGIWVNHGANCPQTKQKGYALLQRFIPHKTTYRVNAIGDARAVFFRYCYSDRPVAQTGNVDPAFEMTEELESLLDYSDGFFAHAGTKWCALDILKDTDGSWKLLETSLAWPWPSPGQCNQGTIFRSGGKKWIQMFDVMFDEYERGAWAR
jgi:hypothetical protein